MCQVLSFLGVLLVSGHAGQPSPQGSSSGSGDVPDLRVCWAAFPLGAPAQGVGMLLISGCAGQPSPPGLQLRKWGQSTKNPR